MFRVIAVALILPVGVGGVRADEAEPVDRVVDAQIEELVEQLGADEFADREAASAALEEVGPRALPILRRELEGAAGTERHRRAERLVRKLELAEIARNAVHLDHVLDLATTSVKETDAAREKRHRELDALIARLVKVVNLTAKTEYAVPCKFAGSPELEPNGRRVQNGIVRVTAGQRLTGATRSVVLLDGAATVSSVDHCIVIARFGAKLSFCKNSIVLSRYELDVSHPQNSVLFSGHRMSLSIAKNCVAGAGGAFNVAIPQETTVLNTEVDPSRLRQGSKTASTPGIVLEQEVANPLKERIQVTAAATLQGGFALFRHGDRGEFVARLGEPLRDPEGRAFEDLAEWRLQYVSGQLAVFAKGDEHAVFNVPKSR